MNYCKRLIFLFISVCVLSICAVTAQAVPERINYQGRLVDGANLVNKSVALTLRLYDDLTAGTLLYEDSAVVTVVDGIYSTFIGDDSTYGSLLPALGSTNLYVEVVVDGTVLTPREPLASVAYALVARNIEDGVALSEIADDDGTGSGLDADLLDGMDASSFATGTPVYVEFDPVWTSASNGYYTKSDIDGMLASGVAEVDPIWSSASNNYLSKPEADTLFWKTGGNTLDPSTTNFIGTLNPRPLEVVVNSERALSIQPHPSSPNLVGGHFSNLIGLGYYGSVISGGGSNLSPNTISANFAAIGGGEGNLIGSGYSVLGGGSFNSIDTNGSYNLIGGGLYNKILPENYYASIGGGFSNLISDGSSAAFIGGGGFNSILSDESFIGGGAYNTIDSASQSSAILGGKENTIRDSVFSTIGGGFDNYVDDSTYSFVGSGAGNLVDNSDYGSIVGGENNTVTGFTSSNQNSFIGGGKDNAIYAAQYSSVVAGENNIVGTDSKHSSIVGGQNNIVIADASGVFVGTANQVVASTNSAVISGFENVVTGSVSSIVGAGFENVIENARYSSILGGSQNGIKGGTASANHNTILGGLENNVVDGSYNTLLGRKARSLSYNGCFVWGDSTTSGGYLDATADNQFIARASGGVIFYSDASMSSGLKINAGAGTWTTLSDRNSKEEFEKVDPKDILERLQKVPVATWKYKTENDTRHIGPMSQDFHAAFQVGPDEKGITTVDADGVALAAIQGLYQTVQEKNNNLEQELQNKQAEIDQLKSAVQELTERMNRIAASSVVQ